MSKNVPVKREYRVGIDASMVDQVWKLSKPIKPQFSQPEINEKFEQQ